MQNRHSSLRGDPIPWLLEPDEPAVRYWTLVDVLGRPLHDREVTATRDAIPGSPIVRSIMARRNRKGLWGPKADYYLPKCSGTFWTLSALGEMGLAVADDGIRQACEYMFAHQGDDGAFRRARQSTGKAETVPMPCTHARIVRFLVRFGLGDDPRTQRAMDWLLATERPDGGWLCDRSGRGCLRATIDYLRAAALVPALAATPTTARAAEWVYRLLLEPGMGRYHVEDAWTEFSYPEFGYSLLGALDGLTRLGYGPDRPKVAAAVQAILDKQDADGRWRMDYVARRPPADFGPAGAPNKWVTLEAVRVIKRLARRF